MDSWQNKAWRPGSDAFPHPDVQLVYPTWALPASSPFLVTAMRRQGSSDPRPLLPNALASPLTCLLPGQKLLTMAPVPAGQALYHLRVICMKNSKALFSSKHAHPHCPMALVTQTITPSPQAPPWLGGGDTGSRPQGFAPCQAQEVELEARLWCWKERPRRLEDGLRAKRHF